MRSSHLDLLGRPHVTSRKCTCHNEFYLGTTQCTLCHLTSLNKHDKDMQVNGTVLSVDGSLVVCQFISFHRTYWDFPIDIYWAVLKRNWTTKMIPGIPTTIKTMGVNITTIVYLRVLIIQIGSTIILMVVEAQDDPSHGNPFPKSPSHARSQGYPSPVAKYLASAWD